MIVYQSKSEACTNLLNEVGIGDFGYKSACALELGEFLLGVFVIIVVIGFLCLLMFCLFSSKE